MNLLELLISENTYFPPIALSYLPKSYGYKFIGLSWWPSWLPT